MVNACLPQTSSESEKSVDNVSEIFLSAQKDEIAPTDGTPALKNDSTAVPESTIAFIEEDEVFEEAVNETVDDEGKEVTADNECRPLNGDSLSASCEEDGGENIKSFLARPETETKINGITTSSPIFSNDINDETLQARTETTTESIRSAVSSLGKHKALSLKEVDVCVPRLDIENKQLASEASLPVKPDGFEKKVKKINK